MTKIVVAVLVLVGLIHLLPAIGSLGPSQLTRLYGVESLDLNVEILLRHRAIMFGIFGVLMVVAGFKPALHLVGLSVGLVSVTSFLATDASVFRSKLTTATRLYR